MHGLLVDKQKSYWIQALKDKRKHIDNAKKYAAQEDTSWWEDFFIDQENIIDSCVVGSWA